MKDSIRRAAAAYKNAAERADAQGARAMRSDEYQALIYAIEACRLFASRQNKSTYEQAVLALRQLDVFSNWGDGNDYERR